MRVTFCSFLFLLLYNVPSGKAQLVLSRSAAVDSAMKNNPSVLAAATEIKRERTYQRSAFYLDKTELWLESPMADRFTIGVQQNFSFPSVYLNEYKLQKNYVKLAEADLKINQNKIGRNTEIIYLELQTAYKRAELFRQMDSIYSSLYYATEKRYSIGDAAYLEKLLEETKSLEIKNKLVQIVTEIETISDQLKVITGISSDSIQPDPLIKMESVFVKGDTVNPLNPTLQYFSVGREVARRNYKLQKSFAYPGFFAGYLNQGAFDSPLLYRFRFGITLPLWIPAYSARIRSARIGIDVADLQFDAAYNQYSLQRSRMYADLRKNAVQVEFYEKTALRQADELIRTSSRLYYIGEISYFNYLQSLSQAMEIKINYLNALHGYNQAVIDLKYLTWQP